MISRMAQRSEIIVVTDGTGIYVETGRVFESPTSQGIYIRSHAPSYDIK